MSTEKQPIVPFEWIATSAAEPEGLRWYQQEALGRLESLRPGRPALLSHPTGSGKTKTAMWWLLSFLARHGGRGLWLAGRTELLDQAVTSLRQHAALMRPRGTRFSVRVVRGGAADDLDGDIVVASVDTLVARGTAAAKIEKAGAISAVIYDEAHHAAAPTYSKLLARLRVTERRFLGLTATPIRTNPQDAAELAAIFTGKFAHQVSYPELMEKGLLAQPKHSLVTLNGRVDVSEAHKQYILTHGHLPPALESQLAEDEPRAQRVAAEILTLRTELRPMIVFAIGTRDAQRVTALLRAGGMNAEYLDGSTPSKKRKELIDGLRKGSTEALVNVGVLTEGTDVPELRGVVIARPTFSDTLYRQMVGRGSRRTPTKTTFTVLDFQDNFSRFAESLACRFALDAEVEPLRVETAPPPSAQTRATPAAPTIPDDVLHAWRVAVGELLRTTDAPRLIEMRLAGWWRWSENGTAAHLLVFEADRALVAATVAELRQRLSGLHAAYGDAAVAAARHLYEERLFASTVSALRFEAMGRAIHAGTEVRFEELPTSFSPDLATLYSTARGQTLPEAWLGEQYDANPAWAIEYVTRSSFIDMVMAVGERALRNDTLRDGVQPAQQRSAAALGHVTGDVCDVELRACGPQRGVVISLLCRWAGLTPEDATVAADKPGALVARARPRKEAETLRDLLQGHGATVDVRTAE